MTVKLEGFDGLKRQLVREMINKRARVKTAVKASGSLVLAQVIRSIMQGKKSGIKYKKRSVTHVASATGEAPASDTGDLAGSFKVIIADSGYVAIIGASGEQSEKSKMLEFGTANIKPRPHLIPALEYSRPAIVARFKKALK